MVDKKESDCSLTESLLSSNVPQKTSEALDTSILKNMEIDALNDHIIREVDEESGSIESKTERENLDMVSLDSKMEREMELKKTIQSKSALMANRDTAYHTNTVTE